MSLARLLDPGRLGRYDGLALHVRRGMGDRPGDRRVPGHPQPSGIELEAHSAYAPGDDLRHLDWNAFGRLDTFLVRRFTAEREVIVHVLLDASASLGVPASDDKLGAATELAMALAYVAVTAGDAVRIAVLGGAQSVHGTSRSGTGAHVNEARVSALYRQRASVRRIADLLAAVRADGRVALGPMVERYAAEHPVPGMALLVSDFLTEPGEVARAVDELRARRYEVHLLHVLGAGELDPTREFTRGVLTDVESGATRAIALTPATLAAYHSVLAAHVDALRELAERVQATYARFVTGPDVVGFLSHELARAGLVRRR
jgi:uncharacterized protein (DUF58 family)